MLTHLFRFLLRIITFFIAVVFILPFVILGILFAKLIKNRGINEFFLIYWSRLLCFVCGISVSIHGQTPNAPVFIVANHVSWLDIPVIHSLTLAGFVAKGEIKNWPVLGWLTLAGDTIFHHRGSQDSRKKVVSAIKQRLNEKRSVAVFPEGTVTDGSYLRHFHRQLIHAAVDTKTPILPVAIKFVKKDGSRNDQMAFIDDESFLYHVWRILSLPSSRVEVHCGELITDFEQGARALTHISRQYIETELKNNDYLPATH